MVIFYGILMVILMVIYGDIMGFYDDIPWDFADDFNGNLWWFNLFFLLFSMGCDGIYPLVICYILKMVIEIVDLHSIFWRFSSSRTVNVYQRVYDIEIDTV